MKSRNIVKLLGPGLLYAGAAVGVSHLVQSTRAGANYGFELVWVLILANAIKYPFFEFGPRYATATGNSLVEGYRNIGKWALGLFTILTFLTMFAIQAAVTVVTAGIVANLFGIDLNPAYLSGIILLVTMVILIVGKYAVLDKLIKYIIVLLAVSTLLAVIFGFLGNHDMAKFQQRTFDWSVDVNIFFIIAFVGWMPAPIDISVWHSLWSVAKRKQLGESPSLKQSLLDFNIGYIGTALLALGFIALGALVMFGSGEVLSKKGAEFAGQLIHMYTSNLGHWAYWLIAIAALTTMFSTTLTVFDAYPRVLRPITKIYLLKDQTNKPDKALYWIWGGILLIGTFLLLSILNNTMGFMVDLATTISFVTAPLFAILNYLVVTDKHMPAEGKPGLWLRVYSWVGIVFLSAFSLFYIVWKFW